MSEEARRVATGAGWLYGYRWAERLIDFVAVVVLARLLSPDDFGLVAIAASVATIVDGLSAFDVDKALIRTRDEDRRLYDTAWTLATGRGLLSGLVMVAVAPLVTEPRLAAVLVALAVAPVVGGLSSPRFVTFERELVYSRLAAMTLGSKVASFAVTVAIALVTRSFWALVVGVLVGEVVATALSYVLAPYRPRFSLARSSDIFAFSGWLSLATAVTTLSMETDKIIVGRLLGVGDAGLYFMTQRVGVLPTRELVSPLQRLLFPSFSRLAGQRGRLRRAVGESINVLGSLGLPAGLGFALVADDFVPLALGAKWTPIVPLLTVLVPYLGLRATLSMTLPCMMALGRTRLLFAVSIVYAVVHLPAFVAGTALFGLAGAIWSIVLAGVFYSWLNAWMLRRTLGVSLGEIGVRLRRPLAAVAGMAGAVVAIGAGLPAAPGTSAAAWLALGGKVAVGAVAYSAVLYGLWRLEGRPDGIERRVAGLLGR